MHEEPISQEDNLGRFVITPLLVLASLYSLYLVIHPFTPFAGLSLGILDLTELQRSTHVLFLLLTGYLISSQRMPGKAGIGAILPYIVLTFLIYNLHGDLMGGVFSHAVFGFDLLLAKLFSETEAGLFGMITGVSAKYLVYFTIMGGIIGALNLGKIIANIASLASRGKADGPGIVTALASVFIGMFSGSGAADTQFVSTISKPMYEKSGYDKYTAAGIAATSGTIAMAAATVGYARRPLRKWESWFLGISSLGLFIPIIWFDLTALPALIWVFLISKTSSVGKA
ncbi:MAG: TRAP transporter large permease subunit [Syntrophales bacterium]